MLLLKFLAMREKNGTIQALFDEAKEKINELKDTHDDCEFSFVIHCNTWSRKLNISLPQFTQVLSTFSQ